MDITPEIQAAIDAAVEAATASLKTKNAQLIEEKRAAKAAETAAQKAAEDAQQAAEEAAETAEAEKAASSTSVEDVRLSLTKAHQKALDKLKQERDALTAEVKTFKVDSVIQKTLVDSNVPAHLHGPLTAYFKADAGFKDLSGDDLSAALSDHFASDAGKHFVTAPQNSGGGATGVSATQATGMKLPTTSSEWTAFYQLQKDDPVQANNLAETWNVPSLKV